MADGATTVRLGGMAENSVAERPVTWNLVAERPATGSSVAARPVTARSVRLGDLRELWAQGRRSFVYFRPWPF